MYDHSTTSSRNGYTTMSGLSESNAQHKLTGIQSQLTMLKQNLSSNEVRSEKKFQGVEESARQLKIQLETQETQLSEVQKNVQDLTRQNFELGETVKRLEAQIEQENTLVHKKFNKLWKKVDRRWTFFPAGGGDEYLLAKKEFDQQHN
jgi:peptidoglycan hydrolase CwlO-like protein